MKILAIDDKPDNLTTLGAVVRDALPEGTVLKALDGHRGIELAMTEDPDVILLDIVMPGMDGFEVCQRLKADLRSKDIPVIFLTALKTDTDNRIKALQLGAEGFLSKPIEPTELIAQIRAMVKVKSSNRFQRNEQARLSTLVNERTQEIERSRLSLLNAMEDMKAESEARTKAEAALRESEDRFRQMAAQGRTFLWETNPQGTYTFVDPIVISILGYSPEELIGKKSCFDMIPSEDLERINTRYHALICSDEVSTGDEHRMVNRDKRVIWVNSMVVPMRDQQGSIIGLRGSATDITARKRRTLIHETSLIALKILNETTSIRESVQNVFDLLKARIDVDAMGLRLQEGEDFPYFIQKGFPDDFLATENSLLRHTDSGECCRDCTGKAFLECTCGLVLSDKVDSSYPSSTKGGSYWSNDTTQFANPANDVRRNPRNKCIDFGYASVALIPIRTHNQPIGLLQLNDHRKNRFLPEEIEGLEDIAAHIGSAITRKNVTESLKASEARYRSVIAVSNTGVWEFHKKTNHFWCSPEYFAILGRHHIHESDTDTHDTVDTALFSLIHPDDRPRVIQHFTDYISAHARGMYEDAFRMQHADGRWIWIWSRGQTLYNPDGTPSDLTIGTHINITKQKEAERAIKDNESRLQSLVRILQHQEGDEQTFLDYALDEAIQLTSSKVGYIYFYNEQKKEFILNTWSKSVMSVCSIRNPEIVYPLEKTGLWGEAVRQRKEILINDFHAENPLKKGYPDGHAPLHRFLTIPIFNGDQIVAVIGVANKETDYTNTDVLQLQLLMDGVWKQIEAIHGHGERLKLYQEKRELEEQVRQSQKLESVGRLAGGMAHDFNNMLQVILGYTEMGLELIPKEHPFHVDLEEIKKVGLRSAELTRQLLAFARKQAIKPKILDLSATVENTLKLLRRLIGEDIQMTLKPSTPAIIKMDPTQVDQLLTNLCVNARDAIEHKGEILISVEPVAVDAAYAAKNPDAIPGEYVLLTVSDTGCGMTAAVRQHIFEPFFTTKQTGKGTGLGLATVYGIVRQNKGFINVHSEVGKGTTFSIHIPLEKAPLEQDDKPVILPEPLCGNETVLLVEDEENVRKTTTRFLEKIGYRVLSAGTAEEALQCADQTSENIHLLLTDVILPKMSGRELAETLIRKNPSVRVIFMSGYPADVISRHGMLAPGICFLPKPFDRIKLIQTLKEALSLPLENPDHPQIESTPKTAHTP